MCGSKELVRYTEDLSQVSLGLSYTSARGSICPVMQYIASEFFSNTSIFLINNSGVIEILLSKTGLMFFITLVRIPADSFPFFLIMVLHHVDMANAWLAGFRRYGIQCRCGMGSHG